MDVPRQSRKHSVQFMDRAGGRGDGMASADATGLLAQKQFYDAYTERPTTRVQSDYYANGWTSQLDNNEEEEEHMGASSTVERKEVPIISRRHALGRAALRDRLLQGMEVVKVGRGNHRRSRKVRYHGASKELRWKSVEDGGGLGSMFQSAEARKRGVRLADIREVRRGKQTDVFAKATLSEDPGCCVSIITTDRSLDLVLGSAWRRDEFIRSLQIIIEEDGLNNDVKYL